MATTVKTTFDIKIDLASAAKSSSLTRSTRYVLADNRIDFASATISDSSSVKIYESATSAGSDGIVCLYFESNAANLAVIDLSLTSGSTGLSTFFARVKPGEKLVIPVWANDANGILIKAVVGATAGSLSTINYFVGDVV